MILPPYIEFLHSNRLHHTEKVCTLKAQQHFQYYCRYILQTPKKCYISMFYCNRQSVCVLLVQTHLITVSLISAYLSLALKLSYWLHRSPSAADGPPDMQEKRHRLMSYQITIIFFLLWHLLQICANLHSLLQFGTKAVHGLLHVFIFFPLAFQDGRFGLHLQNYLIQNLVHTLVLQLLQVQLVLRLHKGIIQLKANVGTLLIRIHTKLVSLW